LWFIPVALAIAVGAGCGGSSTGRDSTAESSTSVGATASGATFTDPQGTYVITVGPDWDEKPGVVVSEVENWIVAPPVGGFAPNVNVVTQAAPGMDLTQYIDFSVGHLGGFELIDSSTIDGSHGNKLGLLEYSGVSPNGPQTPLHFLATVDVRDGRAIVATFTAPEPVFAQERVGVEPFLRTLQAR
jgi:hypothetical protein